MTRASDTLLHGGSASRDVAPPRSGSCSPIPPTDDARLVARAHALYRERRRRDARIGPPHGLFGEPSWDILLDLFVAQGTGRLVSVSSACLTSMTAQSTALRYVRLLETHGFIVRRPDPTDRRRYHLRLTVRGLARMRSYLDEIDDS